MTPDAANALRNQKSVCLRPEADCCYQQSLLPGARVLIGLWIRIDLFVNLTDLYRRQLDFPIVYASALNGIAGLDHEDMAEDMTPLYQAIVDHVPAPDVDLDGPFQMQISQLDYRQ